MAATAAALGPDGVLSLWSVTSGAVSPNRSATSLVSSTSTASTGSADCLDSPRSPRAVFEVLNQGTGGFAFYDKSGHTRALVGSIGDDGAAVAVLQDREGKTVWKVP